MRQRQVRVGIAVFVLKDGKFLMGQRKGAHGAGTWAVPGGHQEFGEPYEETARREVLEETGLRIKNIRFGGLTNDIFEAEDKHYITIHLLADWESGKVQNLEPNKCSQLGWFDVDNMPEPMFHTWQQLLKSEFIDSMKQALRS